MSDKINEVVADLRETARVLSVDVKGFEATAIEIAKTATEVESEWAIAQGRITELERQLAEEKAKANRVQKALLHGTPPEKLATYIDNLESHLSKVTAQLAERDALLREALPYIADIQVYSHIRTSLEAE